MLHPSRAISASGRKGRKLCTTWEVVGEAYTLFRTRITPARSAEATGSEWWDKRESTVLESRSAAHSRTPWVKRWSGRRGLSSRVPIIRSSSFTASATEWKFAFPWEPELAFRPCHHPVLEVSDAGRLDGPDLLELHLRVPEVVEEASTVA
jgi:hypothetical protein